MKDTVTTPLTLVIMVIGLAVIIGGPGAVRFLFAPLLWTIRQGLRVCFVTLVILVLLVAAISGNKATPKQAREAAVPASQSGVKDVGNREGVRNR